MLTHLEGLPNCALQYFSLGHQKKQNVEAIKEKGIQLLTLEKGGSYMVFNQRPMKKEVVIHCVQNVLYLPNLPDKYKAKLGSAVCLDATGS